MIRRAPQRAFALVLVLVLLAVALLATLALAALAKIGHQAARANEHRVQARQNALLGIGMALGELQRLVGPGKTITAQSSLRVGTPRINALTGVWLASSTSADPMTWLISGNQSGNPLTINHNTIISDTSELHAKLVGQASVSASADFVRALKIGVTDPLGQTVGNFAFWVGDEGVKASLAAPTANAPRNSIGQVIRANAQDVFSGYDKFRESNDRLVHYSHANLIAGGANLDANFHSLTARNYSVDAAIIPARLVAGTFNLNTRSVRAWRSALTAVRDAREERKEPANLSEAEIEALVNALRPYLLTARLSGDLGKVQNGPFRSVNAFISSRSSNDMDQPTILQRALVDVGITSLSQQDILFDLEPMLRVQSDTFTVRAYGDSLSATDATIQSVVFCEAIVQRTPEMMPDGSGRRFVITYFRWLTPADI
jgi:hypothetical protein